MSIKSVVRTLLLSVALVTAGSVALAADDPTIQQVYDAASSGHLDQAQSMMQQVLRDHPDSAKAHFVEAEILSKRGDYAGASSELNTAERLAPGLPKEKPEAVARLRNVIAAGERHEGGYNAPARSGSGFPFGLIVVLVLLVGFVMFAVRFMANRNQPPVYVQNGGATGYGGPMPGQPYYGGGPVMGGGGGIGSGIVGGLVTGAALGAGMVAGEELMHHFTDGNGNNVPPRDDYVPPQNDMGGNDFGITDTSSWDDGGSGGGGDSGGGDW